MGKTRKEIRDQILSKQAQIKREELPAGWSFHAASFINNVSNGVVILKAHQKEARGETRRKWKQRNQDASLAAWIRLGQTAGT